MSSFAATTATGAYGNGRSSGRASCRMRPSRERARGTADPDHRRPDGPRGLAGRRLRPVGPTWADRVTAADFGFYATTKAAQAQLAEALRVELVDDRNIRVSLVKPGFMNTPGLGIGTRNPELRQQVEALKERIGLPPAL